MAIIRRGQEPANIKKRLDTLFPKLNEAYPDKVIRSLARDHKKWAETVTELYRALGYPDSESFLKAYGYAVERGSQGRPSGDHTAIIDELKKRYPNGAPFEKMGELQAANPDLAGKFSKTRIIGVGAAIGFSRIFVALMESGAIDLSRFESSVDVSVLCMGVDNLGYAVSVLNALRDENIASVAYLDAGKKFKNQIEYADKIKAKYSMIVGEDEVKNQVVALKDMTTGEQQSLSIADAIKFMRGE